LDLVVDMSTQKVICGDCLVEMRKMPDKSFDLVLTDPPYGIFKRADSGIMFGKSTIYSEDSSASEWDIRPSQEVIDEIKRVGKDYVIWGGNYMADMIGYCKEPWIWDKKTGNNGYADGEMAFTSYTGTLRIFHHQWCGAFKDSERGQRAMHPTQKPVALMSWCMRKLEDGATILDPFMGSGTTLVAAKLLNRNAVGIEISKEYCAIAEDRLRQGVLL
jgi:site-specific DNA-methyltransferase (adenine-specific)